MSASGTPSLSDKLKSLGVKVGTQGVSPQPRSTAPTARRSTADLEAILSGRPLPTRAGETFLVEQYYETGSPYGRRRLQITAPRQSIAHWCGDPRVCDCAPESFAFLDTETTGLSGGTGTYAFLVGIGRYEAGGFHLAQFFLRDPLEEPAQLAAIEEFLAPCQALVTFNGKAFDAPLLRTRYTLHSAPIPFDGAAHVDLLHLARRLWRDRLPSRSLGNLEVQILGAARNGLDVPGWMIPSLYMDYLRFGEVEPLRGVFYHNALDVVSMAALFDTMAALLADPIGEVEHSIDLIALAKLLEDQGDQEGAARLYLHGLEQDLPRPNLLEALDRLAALYKRRGEPTSAIALWQESARYGHLPAHIELAKYFEHHARDYHTALTWAQAAMAVVQSSAFPTYDRFRWLPELERRKTRLERKLSLG